jgi:hypothetical protein
VSESHLILWSALRRSCSSPRAGESLTIASMQSWSAATGVLIGSASVARHQTRLSGHPPLTQDRGYEESCVPADHCGTARGRPGNRRVTGAEEPEESAKATGRTRTKCPWFVRVRTVARLPINRLPERANSS